MLTRIFTENIPGTDAIVAEYFEGFTLIECKGYWQGKAEKSLCIEIIDAELLKIDALVRMINRINNQECCLVQFVQCDFNFLSGR